MGAANVVNAINNDTLTPEQREALKTFLKARRDALQTSIDEIDEAMTVQRRRPPTAMR